MRRTITITIAIALAAAATLALPGAAGAAPAACGAGPAQWVGVYEGMAHVEIENYPDTDIPLDVTITNSATGLKVTTVAHNGEQIHYQYKQPVIENGMFHWSTLQMVGGGAYALHDYYDTTDTSCDSTGKVTQFDGTSDGWVNTEHVSDGTFTLTRTS